MSTVSCSVTRSLSRRILTTLPRNARSGIERSVTSAVLPDCNRAGFSLINVDRDPDGARISELKNRRAGIDRRS